MRSIGEIIKLQNMEHPNPECRKMQEEFLKKCTEKEREQRARLFRIGNVSYRYHQLADVPQNRDSLKLYFNEWLEGLHPDIATDMKKKGLEECKTSLSFTRYVNERAGIGMDEWMKENLSNDDYIYYKEMSKLDR